MPDRLTLTVPTNPRVIALEYAANWMTTAAEELAKGDPAAAVYGVHHAIKFAHQAMDELVPMLAWNEDDKDGPTS